MISESLNINETLTILDLEGDEIEVNENYLKTTKNEKMKNEINKQIKYKREIKKKEGKRNDKMKYEQ